MGACDVVISVCFVVNMVLMFETVKPNVVFICDVVVIVVVVVVVAVAVVVRMAVLL